MRKIILDTNIIVSALIQKNYPYLIVEDCINKGITLCLSESILKEYKEVLKRPKFSKFKYFSINAELLIMRISETAEFFKTTQKIEVIKDDPDNRLLELADVSKADYLITGNSKDFTMDIYGSTKIVSPKQYWEDFK